MAFQLLSSVLLILILGLISQISESHLTHEPWKTVFATSTKSTKGTNWAVLVAGSSGFTNYRHQADICHAYQILKRGGLKDENIIVFMFDDIAYNDENPRRGIIINHPNGEDVYKGVPKDYNGENVTTDNLYAAILGDKKAIKGGSGKVVNSCPNDNIFIYYSDHGGPGILGMPESDDIQADDLIDTLKKKYKMGTYKKMVIYVEACEAGSIFDGLLPKDLNIYVTTASNSDESSYATYCPKWDELNVDEYMICLGDLYSVAWMEDSDMTYAHSHETLEQQYEVVKNRTSKGDMGSSHVMQYGDLKLSKDLTSVYMSSPLAYSAHNQVAVEQYEADIIYLKQKVLRASKGSLVGKLAQQKLDEELSQREQVDHTFKEIGNALFGSKVKGYKMLTTVRPSGQPIVDNWDCFKTLAKTYQKHCGTLSTYGKKYMRAFANMCNAGIKQAQLAKVASRICRNL